MKRKMQTPPNAGGAKQTPKAERRTPNAELITWRIAEQNGAYRDANRTKYDLEQRLLDFASRIVRLVDSLPNTRAGNHIAGQLLRCGTSPLANHGELESAESRNDFVHKLRICLKELRETNRWLRLLDRASVVSGEKLQPLAGESEELIRIFASSVRTAEKNRK
jgi:four helix bundle protein